MVLGWIGLDWIDTYTFECTLVVVVAVGSSYGQLQYLTGTTHTSFVCVLWGRIPGETHDFIFGVVV